MSDTVRVIIADDHAVVREGLVTLLQRDPGLEVVGVAEDGPDAVALAVELDPTVAVLDVSMPTMSGLEATREIKSRTGCRVLILSMHDEPEYVLQAVRCGADGYILKDSPPMDVRQAVRAVAGGAGYFPSSVKERLTTGVKEEDRRRELASRLSRITPREREVLVRVSRGRTSREIAEELGISSRTVETHREHLMEKTGVRTVAGLTRLVVEWGLDRG